MVLPIQYVWQILVNICQKSQYLLKLNSSCQPLLEILLMFFNKSCEKPQTKNVSFDKRNHITFFQKGEKHIFPFFILFEASLRKSLELYRVNNGFISHLDLTEATPTKITSCTVATKKERKKI
jgi:hypothetical protein